MATSLLKHGVKRAFNLVGLEVTRKIKSDRSEVQYLRHSWVGVLRHARDVGFLPATVIDVGAAFGQFSLNCHSVFPEASYILIEPLEENRLCLEELIRRVPRSEFLLAAATARSGDYTISVSPDLLGSSMFLDDGDSSNGVHRIIPGITLDSLEDRLKPPILLKVDVQGGEIDVLRGGEKIISGVESAILEVSFFEFYRGGLVCDDVIAFMKSKGFVVYDLFEPLYRPLDGALAQVNVVFVKEEGMFRKHHSYATREQGERQIATLKTLREKAIDGTFGHRIRRLQT